MSKTRDLANLADLNFDSGTMVVDKVNDRVGVGTSSPLGGLQIGDATVDADNKIVLGKAETSTQGYFPVIQQTSSDGAGNDLTLATTSGNGVLRFFTGNTNNNAVIGTLNNAERMRIDSSGNLLVGKTSAAEAGSLTVYPTGIVQARVVGSNVIIADRTSTDGEIIDIRKDGSTVGSIGVDYGNRLYIGTGGTGLFFNDTSKDIQPISTTAGLLDDTIDLGSTSSRFKNLYLSGGVYLGGTGSANKLDDYEEGTWTPVIQDSSGNSSSTAASQSYYTKIGRQVTVTASLVNLDTTGLLAGDDLRIYGFPFQSDGTSVGSAVVNYLATTSTDQTNSVYSFMPNNNTYVTIYETRRTASGLSSNVSAFTSGFADIYLTHTYFTD